MSFDYEYSFGQKNNWRRWMWNRIVERCQSPRDSLILFLSGKDAIDVELASSKGFSAANMIAVERDQGGVYELRSLGLLTINGSLGTPDQRVEAADEGA